MAEGVDVNYRFYADMDHRSFTGQVPANLRLKHYLMQPSGWDHGGTNDGTTFIFCWRGGVDPASLQPIDIF